MKRMKIAGIAAFSLLFAACGPGEVVVNAEVESMDPETGEQVARPLADLAIQMLPFDRDAVFDSLTAAAEAPEPQLPAELELAQDSIQEARREWREAESEWLALRDELEEILEETQQYNPAETRYRELVQEFDQAEAQYLSAEERKDEAFARMDRLQQETFSEMEEYRALLTSWEEDAFAGYGDVVAERVRTAGREILADTTDASGRAEFSPAPGEWWVYARSTLPTEELYWNVPVTVERGEPVQLELRRENAEARPVF